LSLQTDEVLSWLSIDISEDELQLVTSKVARLAQAAISHPLEPKRRTTMWPVTWHTHDPATVKFYNENPPADDAERDAGYDVSCNRCAKHNDIGS
jgi:hypothetical protein